MMRDQLDPACAGYLRFIRLCQSVDLGFHLTPRAEVTGFALCFAIFGFHLLGNREFLRENAERYTSMLKKNLFEYRRDRQTVADLTFDKAFLQLLVFTLSSLSILEKLQEDPLAEVVDPLVSRNVAMDLDRIGALSCVPQSGNLAMFMAILLIHAREYLGIDSQQRIDQWVDLHLKTMNSRGFWGQSKNMTYLQFQNGYHQYEILEYLGIDNPRAQTAAEYVASLADPEGHFAPNPGGGGCYDYDAVFLLTSTSLVLSPERRRLLQLTATSILGEQNPDGGFAESKKVRPLLPHNLKAAIRHICNAKGSQRKERLRRVLACIKPKNSRIHTHWSNYSREWGESNLWDSWFRMLTVARVECALSWSVNKRWSFIGYPGIGFLSERRAK